MINPTPNISRIPMYLLTARGTIIGITTRTRLWRRTLGDTDLDSVSIIRYIVNSLLDHLVNVLCRLNKSFLNVEGSLRRGLHEKQSMLLGKFLSLFWCHLTSVFQVTLISDEHYGHVLVSVLPCFLQPPAKMLEGVSPGDVIY